MKKENRIMIGLGLMLFLIVVFLIQGQGMDGVDKGTIIEATIGFLGILFSGILVVYQLERSSRDQLRLEYLKGRPALNLYYQNKTSYSNRKTLYL